MSRSLRAKLLSIAALSALLVGLRPAVVQGQQPATAVATVPVTSARLVLRWAAGAHISSAQRLTATMGVALERDSAEACTLTAHGCIRGPRMMGLALAAPGLTGGRVALGGAWLAEPLTGLGGALSVLRTWGAPAQVAPNQTFLGPGVTAYLLGFSMDVTSYWRLAGAAPGEGWFASFRLGLGF